MPAAPANVADHLRRRAAASPDAPALHVPAGRVRRTGPTPHRTTSYRQLDADADRLAAGLTAAGVTRGTRVAVLVPPGDDFFALAFALLRMAAVPVLIDPGMGATGLGNCLAEADPGAFVGVPKAHLARHLLGWLRGRPLVAVTTGRTAVLAGHTLRRLRRVGEAAGPFTPPTVTADDQAAILFTSGSTGPAKGAVYTHGIFAAQVESLKRTFGIGPGEVDLCTFPLFALFGPALGMACVVPDMDSSRPATLDPAKAVAQIAQFGVTNLFGSPAVVRRLAAHGRPLPALRRAISAGAPATLGLVEQFSKLLPTGAELFTPYGATEALPVACVGSRELLETRPLTEAGRGVCVGRPVAGVTVHVVRLTDDPLPEWDESLTVPPGEVGELVVRGPIVTRSYWNRPEATARAKITDRRTGEVLHRMGDCGYLDDRGRVWFCGRKSHRVVTPHGTLFTDMVEPVLNAEPFVRRTALVGVTRRGVTYPVVCFEWNAVDPEREIAAALRAQAAAFPHTARIGTFLEYDRGSFPVDPRHNSKIVREQLAAWADRKLGRRWNGGPA